LSDLGIGIATVRAGNVIGGGDWADNRLIPDILRSFESGKSVVIRNPNATRPWQHVLEPLSGYLVLAQKLYNEQSKFSEGWNFGPDEYDIKPVSWILDNMTSKWPDSSWKLDNNSNPHEEKFLKLDISKADKMLSWHPVWGLELTLDIIISWHKQWVDGKNMQIACQSEIKQYMKDMGK
jgi:CDP-glucose 4,6-dehydratase